jgi:cell division protein FtsI/penicillin-binding protein 2
MMLCRAHLVPFLVPILTVLALTLSASAQQAALDRVLRGTQASAILLDVPTNRILAESGPPALALPGSTLKPFFLLAALSNGLVQPSTTVECRGTLTVAGRNLACTHPRTQTVFDARSALAYSCNTWFAHLAERMTPAQLRQSLIPFGLPFASPLETPEARSLAVLGLTAARVTPLQLARAYRLLALHPNPTVAGALADSVQFGMADNARTPNLAGKTGTARDPGRSWTHGWFAGIVSPPGKPQQVLVVYVPSGSGADAATVAQRILKATQP